MIKNIFALFYFVFLIGCASASRDIYFRPRLPTIENPAFHTKPGVYGEIRAASDRLTIQTTKNLVTNFKFYKDQASWSLGKPIAPTVDVLVGYQDSGTSIPFSVSAMLWGVKGKLLVLDRRKEGGEGFWLVTTGSIAQTPAFESKGSNSCSFCSQESVQKASNIEGEIDTSYKGTELYGGVSLVYSINPSHMFFLGTNHLNGNLYAMAYRKPSDTTVDISESYFADGYGLGHSFLHPSKGEESLGLSISTSINDLTYFWNSNQYHQTVVEVIFNLAFQ